MPCGIYNIAISITIFVTDLLKIKFFEQNKAITNG
jgi:hypothetical protein